MVATVRIATTAQIIPSPLPRGANVRTPTKSCFPGLTYVCFSNDIWIGSSVFAGFVGVLRRHTDTTLRREVCSNSPHSMACLRSVMGTSCKKVVKLNYFLN